MNLNDILLKSFHDKVKTITQFRRSMGGLSYQALQYAIKNEKVDFIAVDERTKLIVLTKKTLEYQPNENINRAGSAERKAANKAPVKKAAKK